MTCLCVLFAVSSLFLLPTASATSLSLRTEYQGSSFFDAWIFYSGTDTNTTGNVYFETRETAMSSELTYVSDGKAVIKVDNSTSGAGNSTYGRSSVKLYSEETVSQGSLVVLDATHVPYGCSVWPAFWLQGSNWPVDGEIDIFENVNLAQYNRYALHTTDGCKHPDNSSSTSIETGTLISTDCYNATNGNQGCVVEDPSTTSYGDDFYENGGGVFAMLWNDDGIKMWFFNRSSIPSDIEDSPDPDNWTTPTANWPNSSCDVSQFFGAQTITLDITLCGNYAGSASVYEETCSGTCTDLIQEPSNYDTAYFEINYVRVFSR
ncbi:hypothetical protein ACEPAF_5882 [Sanghuangporus sanghuang]